LTPNSFGELFRITTFGESHGPALGVVIEGVPAGLPVEESVLRDLLARRRPGSSASVSARAEPDTYEILSGVFEGKALGTPVAVMVRNTDARSSDYDDIQKRPRPGHADQAWRDKFGHVDHRGGGRSSGRETLARVIGGAFAKMTLLQRYPNLRVQSFPRQIGPLVHADSVVDFSQIWGLSAESRTAVEELLAQAKTEGQSYGGIGEVWVRGLPSGLGEPVFMKLKSELAGAMISLGATMGFEIGDGFAVVDQRGTDIDFEAASSGQSGGISNGEDLMFRVAFKPTSSVLDIAKKGRHDPCIVLRALVVLEAMTWLVLVNLDQWRRLNQ
jgi:chorismate synthase